MSDRSRGRSQTKRDTLVPHAGGWAWDYQSHTVKTKLFRNQIISLGWMEGNQWHKWATTSSIYIILTSSIYHSTLHRLNKWRTERNGGWLFMRPKLTLSCSAEGKEGRNSIICCFRTKISLLVKETCSINWRYFKVICRKIERNIG
jgi:hypothetical protein